MKTETKFLSLVSAVALGMAGVAFGQQQPVTVRVQEGTVIRVVLAEDISSATNHQNDAVHFEVAEDVKVNGKVAVAKGAQGIGHISQVERKGGWGHSGQLSYSIDYARAVDGCNVRLRATAAQGGHDSKGAIMLGLVGGLKRGKDVSIPKGTMIDAYVDADRDVSVAVDNAQLGSSN